MPFPNILPKSMRKADRATPWKDGTWFHGLTIPPMPSVQDPGKPRIDITEGDLTEYPTPPKMADKRLYDFVVNECFKEARDARWSWELEWSLSLEFYNDNQWFGIDPVTRMVYNALETDPDPMRLLQTNMIKPRIDAVASMVTQSAPEAIVVPLTNAPRDVQAAAEGQGIQSHYNRKFGIKQQVREAVDWAMTYTTAFCKTTFEPGLLVDTPEWSNVTRPDGSKEREIVGATTKPLGDILERIIPGARIYLDPAALKFEDCRWLIHAELYPKSWYVDNFENGEYVTVDPGGGVISYANRDKNMGVSSALGFSTAIIGETAPRAVNKNVATCYEMWILPGIISSFPYGAVIRCAGGQVLIPRKHKSANSAKKANDGDESGAESDPVTTSIAAWSKALGGNIKDGESVSNVKKRVPGNYIPWPYECVTEFPFVPLSFKRNPNSPYGLNLVKPLIEPQQQINRIDSRVNERLEKEKPILLRKALDGAGADQYSDMGVYAEVKVRDVVGVSQWIVQPEISVAQFKRREQLQLDMDDIAGIHDPNFRGEVSADASGVAIAGLQKGDASRLSEFGANIERFVEGIGNWRLRHAAQFFGIDRLMGMDESGNPANMGKTGVSDYATIKPPFHGQPGYGGMSPSNLSEVQSSRLGPGPGIPAPDPEPMPNGPMQDPVPPKPALPHDPDAPTGDPTEAPTANPYANAMSFKALTSGGQARVVVSQGSALADTPDAWNAQVMADLQIGAFGPQGSVGAAKIAQALKKDPNSAMILQRLDELQHRIDIETALSQPPPPPPPPSPIDIIQAQGQVDAANKAAQIDAETRQKVALVQAQTESQIAIIRAKASFPSITLAGKLTPAGEVAAEEEAGLDVHGSAAHLGTVGTIAPDVHAGYGVGPLPSHVVAAEQRAAQNEQAGAVHGAALGMATAEHGAGLAKDTAEHQNALTQATNAQQSALQTEQMKAQAALQPKAEKGA